MDYYQLLGLSSTATATEIKQAYYNQLKTCHPDVVGHNHYISQVKQLNHAYTCLAQSQAIPQQPTTPHPAITSNHFWGTLRIWLIAVVVLIFCATA